MNRFITVLVALLLFTSLRHEARAWGSQGHTAMWTVAQSQLTEPARKKLNSLLTAGEIAKAAVWMDDVRYSARTKVEGKPDPLADDADAQDLNVRFPTNDVWHYVDLPLGAKSYADAKEFTSSDDIVQRINHCLRVLAGQEHDLSERVALRVLIHLVGDIHQPLHCASGFYDLTDLEHPKLVTDPVAALPLKQAKIEDRGGNQLKHGKVNLLSLHYEFDVLLLKDLTENSEEVDKLVAVLQTQQAAVDATTPGDHATWAEQWANESLRLTAALYQDLSFGPCTLRTLPADIAEKGKIDTIRITLAPGFRAAQTLVASSQLTKSSARLAALLNTLWK